MVKLEKMTSSERVDLCRKYFFIGLACAPLVWIVNFCWFYKYGFCSSPTGNDNDRNQNNLEDNKNIQKYLMLSAIGILYWTVLTIIWLYVYTVNKAMRTEWADWITYIFPLGRI